MESRTTLLDTLDYMERVMGELQTPLQTLYRLRGEIEEVENDCELQQYAIFVLNKLEGICIRIHQGLYPEGPIEAMWASSIINIYTLLKPFIQRRRRLLRSSDLWVELEQAVGRWSHK
jgi:hypothetical protein